ncbi:MAG: ice-binding family protein [Nonlabens sp.]|uniref:ice-binding family protein n=1 Tax=Nonlabens sp. TaxID=1888209 RepID=UPI0035A727AD
MKHTLRLYLFYFLLLAPNAYPQLIKVIDNKGTINEVENSKWFFSVDKSSIYNAATQKSVGIGKTSVDGSAVLELTSTSKGFLPPRLTTSQRDAITAAAIGLCIFNTSTNAFEVNIGSVSLPLWASIADNAITTAKILDAAVTDDKIASGISKSKVGLSNVDNTADDAKPVSSATQSALDLKVETSSRGAENGVASLVSGKIPSEQIPSISFTSVNVVPAESDMLNLSSIVGSIAIRTDQNKNYVLSQADASILSNWVELLTPGSPVQSVNGKTGSVLLNKTDFSLNNVDNTADLNKPISTETKNYIDGQISTEAADATASATGKIKLAGDLAGTAVLPQVATAAITTTKLADYAVTDSKVGSGISKSKVGLTNVDNTSDSNKPVSTDTQYALDLKLDSSTLGLANGAASLDANGKVPSSQIPSLSVSSIEVVNSEAAMLALPDVEGTTAIRTDNNKNYILSQADASNLSNWIQLATPDASIQSVNGQTGTVLLTKADLSLANINNTSDADKPLSSAATQAIDLKENLSNKSVDLNMDADSDLKYPSVKAVKNYVDGTVNANTTTETTAREAADETLTLNLDSEITRARAAEAIHTTGLSNAQSQINAITAVDNGSILVGDGNNKASEVLLSGDATLDNTGKLTIITNAITTDKIKNANVSYAKIQNVTTNTVLGRTTAGKGPVEEINTTGSDAVVLSSSPTLTGEPLAPTAAAGTNSTQLATTAFVLSNSDRYYSVNESTEITTRTTTDEAIPGMAITSEPGGTYSVIFNAQYAIDPTDRTAQTSDDMRAAYNSLKVEESTETIAGAIPTRTFTPGVYTVAAAGTVAASVTITLDGSGVYIFRFGAAFSMGANVIIKLTGGATAEDVFWIAENAVAIGAGATIKGSLISNNGAVDLGTGCSVDGKLLAINSGAISLSTSTVTNTGSSSAVNWDLASSFALFSTGGTISNAGSSTVTGDIGTKSGSITKSSFDAATVNGTFYTSLVSTAIASFSLYQNGSLIANSTRTGYSSNSNVDVTLHAIATVAENESIDVRWRVDSGKIILVNRILTVLSVR